MTYTALDKKPKCRLYRVSSKKRIPNPMPHFIGTDDEVFWWSDGKRRFLQIIEHTVRSARDVPKQSYIKIKETHHHWYELTNRRT